MSALSLTTPFGRVTKFDPAGRVVYSTYLGGSAAEYSGGIAVDSVGNAYVTGLTYSMDFPTVNPFQGARQGFSYDAFVAKLDPSGSALVYSTYLGGSSDDYGYGIAVDSAGSVHVAGLTYSVDFPTVTPFQGGLREYQDAFMTKLDPSGSALAYSTYLGGTLGEWGYRIAVDSAGNAYVTGSTSARDFPTKNAAQPVCGCFEYLYCLPGEGCAPQAVVDAFVTKMNP